MSNQFIELLKKELKNRMWYPIVKGDIIINGFDNISLPEIIEDNDLYTIISPPISRYYNETYKGLLLGPVSYASVYYNSSPNTVPWNNVFLKVPIGKMKPTLSREDIDTSYNNFEQTKQELIEVADILMSKDIDKCIINLKKNPYDSFKQFIKIMNNNPSIRAKKIINILEQNTYIIRSYIRGYRASSVEKCIRKKNKFIADTCSYNSFSKKNNIIDNIYFLYRDTSTFNWGNVAAWMKDYSKFAVLDLPSMDLSEDLKEAIRIKLPNIESKQIVSPKVIKDRTDTEIPAKILTRGHDGFYNGTVNVDEKLFYGFYEDNHEMISTYHLYSFRDVKVIKIAKENASKLTNAKYFKDSTFLMESYTCIEIYMAMEKWTKYISVINPYYKILQDYLLDKGAKRAYSIPITGNTIDKKIEKVIGEYKKLKNKYRLFAKTDIRFLKENENYTKQIIEENEWN